MKNFKEAERFKIRVECPCCKQDIYIYPEDNFGGVSDPKISEEVHTNLYFYNICEQCKSLVEYECSILSEIKDVQRTQIGNQEIDMMTFKESYIVCDEQKRKVMYNARNVNKVVEKARIFQMGLDDRIVEIIKVWAYLEKRDELNELCVDLEETSCWVTDEGDLRLYFWSNGEVVRSATVRKNAYEKFYSMFYEGVEASFTDEQKTAFVDMEWAFGYLMDYMKNN